MEKDNRARIFTVAAGVMVQRPYLARGCANIVEHARMQLDNPEFDPEATVVALSSGEGPEVLCLNMTAAFAFEALVAGRDDSWIVEHLAELFDADRMQIAEDVRGIVEELLDRGMVAPR